MNSVKNLALGLGLFFASVSAAHATPVQSLGVPVASFTSDNQVVPLGPNNFIEMFIPISAAGSGVFGVNGVGTAADNGSGGGNFDMFLNFGIFADPLVNVQLVFDFIDFDLGLVNDINEVQQGDFQETVRFFGVNGFTTAVIEDIEDDVPGMFSVDGNFDTQQIIFTDISNFFTPSATDPFVIGLNFSSFVTLGLQGLNTAEYVRATLYANAVPEPATLALLASGGLFAGWGARRRAAKK